MSISFKPARISTRLFGVRQMYRKANLGEVLSVFERDEKFAPTKWNKLERGGVAYNREEILEWLGDESVKRQATVFLKRQKAPKYTASIYLGIRPAVAVEFDPKLPAKHWPNLFRFSDELAVAFKPDIGATHLWPRQPDVWETDEDRDCDVFSRCGGLFPVDYWKVGPHGLTIRTHLGPHFISQFGKPLIESLPLSVEWQDWGGVRIDLVEEPWEADLPTLLAAWQGGMSHLRPAQIFAEAECRQTEHGPRVSFTKGAKCDVAWDHEREKS